MNETSNASSLTMESYDVTNQPMFQELDIINQIDEMMGFSYFDGKMPHDYSGSSKASSKWNGEEGWLINMKQVCEFLIYFISL